VALYFSTSWSEFWDKIY